MSSIRHGRLKLGTEKLIGVCRESVSRDCIPVCILCVCVAPTLFLIFVFTVKNFIILLGDIVKSDFVLVFVLVQDSCTSPVVSVI